MSNRELPWPAKLALLVASIAVEPLVKFTKQSVIVFAFHNQLFFHDFEETRLSLALKQLYTVGIVAVGDSLDVQTW